VHRRALFITATARVLIASVFVGLGFERLLVGAGLLAGAPVSAGAVAFSAFELIAGLAVMLGWKVRWVASLLALFILVDAFLAHAFWTYPAAEQHGQLLHFLKNLSTRWVVWCSSRGWTGHQPSARHRNPAQRVERGYTARGTAVSESLGINSSGILGLMRWR
jgi:putative oxidoreductase